MTFHPFNSHFKLFKFNFIFSLKSVSKIMTQKLRLCLLHQSTGVAKTRVKVGSRARVSDLG